MFTLFDPLTINQLQLPNRFVRSATYDNLADQGRVSDAQLNLYDTLSRGEIGLIISAGIYPAKNGMGAVDSSPQKMMIQFPHWQS